MTRKDEGRALTHVVFLLLAFAALVWLVASIVSCATVQVLDGRRVPRHPRPDSAATFPMRERAT
jgi:hypothetical protein